MNVVEGLTYLKSGLVTAGLKPTQVVTGMDLTRPANTDSVPGASVYCVQSRFTRSSRRERITAAQLRVQVDGATGGVRRSLMDGLTWFEVTVAHKSMPLMQNCLTDLLAYLAETPLADSTGKKYTVLGEGTDQERELFITWNDHHQEGRVTATFQLALPGIVFTEHPRLPIDIEVQYRLEGGNDHE